MILPDFKINFTFKILFIALLIFQPNTNYSQQKFGLETDWNWEDLFNKAVFINPALIKTVDNLKRELSVKDARYIVKHLSELDSLQQLKNLFTYYEKEESVSVPDSVINIFKETDFQYRDDIENLINSMKILSGLRNSFNPGKKFLFTGKNYLSEPSKKSDSRIEIIFDYSEAENILKYFSGDTDAEKEIKNNITDKEIPIEKAADDVKNNDLIYLLNRASAESPLFSLYKWVNPLSYCNFGGIYIYRDEFSDLINKIRDNESNIRSDAVRNTIKNVPDSTSIKVRIKFKLGNQKINKYFEERTIEINLENFNDDYSYLVRYIIHELYKTIEREIHLSVEEYIADARDRELIALISEIQKNGIANYAGPLGSETRPWDLLEKDFQLFNNTFYHLKKYHGKNIKDSLIRSGFEGNAPFYTMATQMAYIIETTLGRNALTESVFLGPVSFFNKYIKAYKDYPDKIRRVFTFRKDFEKKISELEKKLPEKILKSAMSINKMNMPGEEKIRKTEEFVKNCYSETNAELIYFLSGQLLLEADQYRKSSEYFFKGLNLKKGAGNISCIIGNSFMKKKAFEEAKDFFDECVKSNSGISEPYEMRGECFYYLNDKENSLSDFNKALTLNPYSELSKKFINNLNK